MDIQRIANSLSASEKKVLPFLKTEKTVEELIKKSQLNDAEVMHALLWLSNKGLVKITTESREVVCLGKNGQRYAKSGLPERIFMITVGNKTASIDEIKKESGLSDEEIKVSIGLLKNKGIIESVKGETIQFKLSGNGRRYLSKKLTEEDFLDKLTKGKILVSSLSDIDKFALNNLKSRKDIVNIHDDKIRHITITSECEQLMNTKLNEGLVEMLTPQMIKNSSWKNKDFRVYDLKSSVPKISFGKKHFVNEAISYARQIWLDMGFKEMTGPIVSTSFWNFDALFVPQDHPARDMQDTFFLDNPGYGKLPNKKLVINVKTSHEKGVKGSSGWGYSWDEHEAKKNVLRTHTTVLSSKTLAKLNKSDIPAKFFSIGRCYRNETLDWSHLFEFNQTEGIVIDPNANLRHLLGYLKEFANKMGYKKVRFRPSYFPYTEPSLEGDVYDPVRKKWIEVIAAGIFRPEVVEPLLGKAVPVLAWGPGLDRMIAGLYNLTDIRDLYENDLKQLRGMKALIR